MNAIFDHVVRIQSGVIDGDICFAVDAGSLSIFNGKTGKVIYEVNIIAVAKWREN